MYWFLKHILVFERRHYLPVFHCLLFKGITVKVHQVNVEEETVSPAFSIRVLWTDSLKTLQDTIRKVVCYNILCHHLSFFFRLYLMYYNCLHVHDLSFFLSFLETRYVMPENKHGLGKIHGRFLWNNTKWIKNFKRREFFQEK